MADRPILFNAAMVNALLDGRKTQTRRLATNKNVQRIQVGDRLYVREAFCYVGTCDPGWIIYGASDYDAQCKRYGFDDGYPPRSSLRFKSSRFMPRVASRLTLTVTEKRLQSLQEIDDLDAMAEGWPKSNYGEPVGWFADLWNEINPKNQWHTHPDVIALTFTVHRGNIDSMEQADG